MLTKHWRRALAALLLGTVSPVSSFAWQDDSAKKTITYTLQHRQPADVYRALEPLIGDPKNCTIQTVDAQRQLIVTGPNWVHETAQEVIRQLEHADNNVRVEPELWWHRIVARSTNSCRSRNDLPKSFSRTSCLQVDCQDRKFSSFEPPAPIMKS